MPSSSTFGLAEHLPGLLMAAGVSLLTFLVLMNLRFKMQRRAASRHISPAFAAGLAGGTSGFEDSGHRHENDARPGRAHQPATIDHPAVVEAHESVRLLINALDTRCKALEVLLRQADDRIRQLEDALDDRVGASISPTRTAVPERPRHVAGASSVDRAHETPSRHPLTETSEPPRVEVAKFGGGHLHEPLDPLTASVYELADRGRTPVEIARNLDEQVGKVELILALRGDH